jgi:ketol-acid reductoisomerase
MIVVTSDNDAVGIDELRQGTFAREWESERRADYPVLKRLKAEALAHPINKVKDRLREMMRIGE